MCLQFSLLYEEEKEAKICLSHLESPVDKTIALQYTRRLLCRDELSVLH